MGTPSAAVVVLLSAAAQAAAPAPGALPEFKPGRSDTTFRETPPHSADDELRARLGARDKPPAYDVGKEKFRVFVPAGYKHADKWGLLVWINPGDGADLPAGWEAALARHKLLAVSAHKSGNPRNVFDRMRLAIDGCFNMQKRFNIDTDRVYVGGFSGGGRVASFLAVAYPDLFTGGIFVCGVNFYKNVPAEPGKVFGRSFDPAPEALEIAKKSGRFALVTGEKDFNRLNTRAMHEHGFVKEGFKHAEVFEVPGMGHSVPGAEWFDKALKFLDGPLSGKPGR